MPVCNIPKIVDEEQQDAGQQRTHPKGAVAVVQCDVVHVAIGVAVLPCKRAPWQQMKAAGLLAAHSVGCRGHEGPAVEDSRAAVRCNRLQPPLPHGFHLSSLAMEYSIQMHGGSCLLVQMVGSVMGDCLPRALLFDDVMLMSFGLLHVGGWGTLQFAPSTRPVHRAQGTPLPELLVAELRRAELCTHSVPRADGVRFVSPHKWCTEGRRAEKCPIGQQYPASIVLHPPGHAGCCSSETEQACQRHPKCPPSCERPWPCPSGWLNSAALVPRGVLYTARGRCVAGPHGHHRERPGVCVWHFGKPDPRPALVQAQPRSEKNHGPMHGHGGADVQTADVWQHSSPSPILSNGCRTRAFVTRSDQRSALIILTIVWGDPTSSGLPGIEFVVRCSLGHPAAGAPGVWSRWSQPRRV